MMGRDMENTTDDPPVESSTMDENAESVPVHYGKWGVFEIFPSSGGYLQDDDRHRYVFLDLGIDIDKETWRYWATG